MALIQCKFCGETVSEKALVCPHCGQSLVEEGQIEKTACICEECGAELPEGAECCPVCGCPVEEEKPVDIAKPDAPQKVELAGVSMPKMDKKKKTIILSVAAVLLVAAILAVVGIRSYKKSKAEELRNEYAVNLETATFSMLSGAAKAETAGNLIKSVWYNCIYEESSVQTDKFTKKNSGYGAFYDDFNDALVNLFCDEDFRGSISEIEDNQEFVADMMKDMKNPPEEHKEAYETLKDLYDEYLELTNLVTNPSGNLQSFSTSFNTADSDFMNCYRSMQLYIGE